MLRHVRRLCRIVASLLLISALGTILSVTWTLSIRVRVNNLGPPPTPTRQAPNRSTPDVGEPPISNTSLEIVAIDGFVELVDGQSPLRIPQELEGQALELCSQQTFNGTQTLLTATVVVPSVLEYQCDVLKKCAQEYEQLSRQGITNICPCFSSNLAGKITIDTDELEETSWDSLLSLYKDLLPGGHWKPRDCMARRRLAVVIPFRDRQRHLRAFLAHFHPILQRQMIEYRIFVVEQNMPFRFNKASLMNIGYLEAKKLFKMDCVLFHDVDTLIERDDNIIVCGDKPIHFAAYADRHHYRLRKNLFGSAVLLTGEMFEAANGFSNLYYGWGAEDDDFRARLLNKKFQIYKVPTEIGRCSLLKHKRDVLFYNRYPATALTIFRYASRRTLWYSIDGLNSVQYTVLERKELPLFTWIHVDLKVPLFPTNLTNIDKRVQRSQKYMLRNVDAAFKFKSSTYYLERGNCLGEEPSLIEPLYLSRVTCRYLCDIQSDCRAVQYHDGGYSADDYCYLITELETCRNSSSAYDEIYRKNKH